MRKFKALFTSLVAAAALAASACWFGENYTGTLQDSYISHLSGDVVHYEVGKSGVVTIHNGQSVALPFTVFVKVSPHKTNAAEASAAVDAEVDNGKPIVKAVLQYKIVNGEETTKSGIISAPGEDGADGWVTVKTIDNPNWDMDFDSPVALFGQDCIDIPNITKDTDVIIRVMLSDGTFNTGDIQQDLDGSIPDEYIVLPGTEKDGSIQNINSGSSGDIHFWDYKHGWTAPFVMKVKVKPNTSATEGGSGTKRPTRRPRR